MVDHSKSAYFGGQTLRTWREYAATMPDRSMDIVSVIDFQGALVIATASGVFRLKDRTLESLKFYVVD